MSNLNIKDLEGVKVQAAQIKKWSLSIIPTDINEIKEPLKGVIVNSFVKVGKDIGDLATMVTYLAEYTETMEQRIKLIEEHMIAMRKIIK